MKKYLIIIILTYLILGTTAGAVTPYVPILFLILTSVIIGISIVVPWMLNRSMSMDQNKNIFKNNLIYMAVTFITLYIMITAIAIFIAYTPFAWNFSDVPHSIFIGTFAIVLPLLGISILGALGSYIYYKKMASKKQKEIVTPTLKSICWFLSKVFIAFYLFLLVILLICLITKNIGYMFAIEMFCAFIPVLITCIHGYKSLNSINADHVKYLIKLITCFISFDIIFSLIYSVTTIPIFKSSHSNVDSVMNYFYMATYTALYIYGAQIVSFAVIMIILYIYVTYRKVKNNSI